MSGPAAFERRIADVEPAALHAERIDLLQVNIGLRCNTACSHCHQSCSPTSTEIMTDDTLATVCALARELRPEMVDITGGSPELHPGLRGFVSCLRDAGLRVQVRTNLTALLEPEAAGLAEFFADRSVELLASLPALDAEAYAHQRSQEFDAALDVLGSLNALGYGRGALRLNLAVNPDGEDLGDDTDELRQRYRARLTGELGIDFDDVVPITNVPVGRFRAMLQTEGRLEEYLASLECAFNPATVNALSCRTMLEVAWDGTLADCDFNLGAGMRVAEGVPARIDEFDAAVLATRRIRFGEHCWACTAAAGSS